MAGSSIAICGLARDCAAKLRRLRPAIERLAAAFASSRIIVVENDSRDDTGAVLEDWQRIRPDLRCVRFCYLDPPGPPAANGGWFGGARMERMTFARNLYLDALGEEAIPDFMVLIDLDIRSFDLGGVEHSFGLHRDWDVVTAYGARYSLRHPLRTSVYWDSYAYEPADGFPGGAQTAGQIRDQQLAVARQARAGRLIPARSAFGGLAIYRANLLGEERYRVEPNEDPEVSVLCDHPTLHRALHRRHAGLRLMINPQMKVNYGSATQLAREALGRSKG